MGSPSLLRVNIFLPIQLQNAQREVLLSARAALYTGSRRRRTVLTAVLLPPQPHAQEVIKCHRELLPVFLLLSTQKQVAVILER
jgi:hypothetical protein